MILTLLLACKPSPPTPLIPTGWFGDTGDTDDTDAGPTRCSARVEETRPEQDDLWYWRDFPRVSTTVEDPERIEAYVVDAAGYRLPSQLVWPTNSLNARVQLEGPLAPDADHVLRIVDCEGTREVAFRTSTLGLPLVDGPSTLAGKVYHLDLQGADWVEPGGVAALLTLYFDSPGLLDVAYVTEQQLQLRFTLGYFLDSELRQDTTRDLIPFPTVSFVSQPFFDAEAALVELDFSGATIPVYDFAFSGTFAADGNSIGGGAVSGLGDTRYAGDLVGDDSPNAVCDLAAGFGVACVPCPDGEPLCLPVSIQNIQGSAVDLVLVP